MMPRNKVTVRWQGGAEPSGQTVYENVDVQWIPEGATLAPYVGPVAATLWLNRLAVAAVEVVVTEDLNE